MYAAPEMPQGKYNRNGFFFNRPQKAGAWKQMKKMKVKRGISAKNDLTSKEGTGIIIPYFLSRGWRDGLREKAESETIAAPDRFHGCGDEG